MQKQLNAILFPLSACLLINTPLAQAEFSNTSYSFFALGSERVNYSEHLNNFGGSKVDSSFSATNIVQRSGGYTAIDDTFGFFIKTASTLITEETTEDWDAKGFSGPIQQDTAAMNFQMLDINLAYHLGNGGYLLGGVHYQKISFSRFGWKNTNQTNAFANSVEDYIRNTPALYDPIVQGITDGLFTDANGNPITTENEYFAATRFSPEDTEDVVFEDSTSASITAGFEFDSYFINQNLGLRYMAGAQAGYNIYEYVLNSSQNRSLSRNFGGGIDLHVSAGFGYQFKPEIGAMLILETNATWRDGIKDTLPSGQSIQLPDNTFYAYALTSAFFWNF